MKRTALFDAHLQAGARMVPFGGWEMPLHYGSQLDEHRMVRSDVGLFDVSHMAVADLRGAGATELLRLVLANDVAGIREDGGALYSCMLNPAAGIVDDLICYRVASDWYRLVLNAATAESDLAWIATQAEGRSVTLDRQKNHCILALQGPRAPQVAAELFSSSDELAKLRRFHGLWIEDLFVARTGYTGEDGYELVLPAAAAMALWRRLLSMGVRPAGLGARDTLRLEAGFNLYGADMDETVSPVESGLAWTVAWEPNDRDFIGRAALTRQIANGTARKRWGVILREGGVLRGGMQVTCDGAQVGMVTSGGYGPTVGCSIGLARIDAGAGSECEVSIRGKTKRLELIDPPFARNGESLIGFNQ